MAYSWIEIIFNCRGQAMRPTITKWNVSSAMLYVVDLISVEKIHCLKKAIMKGNHISLTRCVNCWFWWDGKFRAKRKSSELLLSIRKYLSVLMCTKNKSIRLHLLYYMQTVIQSRILSWFIGNNNTWLWNSIVNWYFLKGTWRW